MNRAVISMLTAAFVISGVAAFAGTTKPSQKTEVRAPACQVCVPGLELIDIVR